MTVTRPSNWHMWRWARLCVTHHTRRQIFAATAPQGKILMAKTPVTRSSWVAEVPVTVTKRSNRHWWTHLLCVTHRFDRNSAVCLAEADGKQRQKMGVSHGATCCSTTMLVVRTSTPHVLTGGESSSCRESSERRHSIRPRTYSLQEWTQVVEEVKEMIYYISMSL